MSSPYEFEMMASTSAHGSSHKASGVSVRDRMENRRLKYEKVFRRITKFKKYTSDMCTVISNHAVKIAGLRDKTDDVAKCLDDFTKIEEFSTTSKLSMAIAAELLATVGDQQDLAVQRVETLVLPNLSSYARICDCIKADVWNAIQAIRREKRKKKSVQTLKRKDDPKTKSCLGDAQRELERASAETARFCHLSEEQVVKFEHKRLMDLKESLGTFVKIQIASHARSLELLGETYKQIQSIDEDGDLEILKSCLKVGGNGGDDGGKSSKKKSSSKAVPQKKKMETSGQRRDSKKKMEGYSDEEEYVTEDDSSHSEVVRRLEKVLHSSRREVKREERRRGGGKEDGGNRRDNPQRGSGGRRRDGGDRVSEQEEELEEYIPMSPKILGKRPSTPPRPITAPPSGRLHHRSSKEDMVTSHKRRDEDPWKVSKNQRHQGHCSAAPIKGGHLLDSYYYSQSEDDKKIPRPSSRGPPDIMKQSGHKKWQSRPINGTSSSPSKKHVSFYNPNSSSGQLKLSSGRPGGLLPTGSRKDAGDFTNNQKFYC